MACLLDDGLPSVAMNFHCGVSINASWAYQTLAAAVGAGGV
jgi:hypothetical protein